MNKNLLGLLVVVVVVLVTLGAVVVSRNSGLSIKGGEDVKLPVQPSTPASTQKTFSAQTDSQGEVSVEVTPKVLEASKEANFQITFTTHSVELDHDLVKVSKLIDERGNEYLPISWSGGTGGHHLSGELTFPKISDQTKSAELLISGVGGVERKFKWDL